MGYWSTRRGQVVDTASCAQVSAPPAISLMDEHTSRVRKEKHISTCNDSGLFLARLGMPRSGLCFRASSSVFPDLLPTRQPDQARREARDILLLSSTASVFYLPPASGCHGRPVRPEDRSAPVSGRPRNGWCPAGSLPRPVQTRRFPQFVMADHLM